MSLYLSTKFQDIQNYLNAIDKALDDKMQILESRQKKMNTVLLSNSCCDFQEVARIQSPR